MKIVTLGEILLRLTSPRHERIIQSNCFEVNYGGGEANVAISLSALGQEAVYVTKLPTNEIGQAALDSLRCRGVNTSNVIRGEGRLGIYFMERGASQRPSRIIYDRNYSAFSLSDPEEYDWEKIFAGVQWFHFSGITLALGENARTIIQSAVKYAKQRNIRISCDINYRNKLWTIKEARPVYEQIMSWVDVCIVNESQAREIFNIVTGDEKELAEKLFLRYKFTTIAFTYRRTLDAERNIIWATLYQNGEFAVSDRYEIEMVDRIGGGDAFSAGLIYALGKSFPVQKAVQFAMAASCLKHSIEGDANLVSAAEVEELLNGGNGCVQR